MAEHHARHADEHAEVHGHHGGGDPDPEIPVSTVAKILVALAVVGLVAAAVVWPLVHGFLRSNLRRQPEARIDLSRPSGPLLQAQPEIDLRAFRARENVVLGSYGWVDESSGIARIPVGRAAELILEQGIELSSPRAAPSTLSEEPQ